MDDETTQSDGAWQRGLALIREGGYWEAHEEFEEVWHSIPEGAERDATQALIQFAAAAYKIEQARDGRDADSMRRGMEKLVARALVLLDGWPDAQVPWEVGALRDALEDLDRVRVCWAEHRDGDAARDCAREVATTLVASLER